jgi:tetratricopeptide (TPR) repeat protein
MLKSHKLVAEAKREAIDVVFGDDKEEIPGALELLGEIAVEEGNYSAAVDAWQRLIKDYGDDPAAKRASVMMPKLREAVLSLTDASVNDAVAQNHLLSADFWSSGRDRTFTIDSSWLPKVEAALHWYDRVIAEFPGSAAARLAFERKLMTIRGWETGGRYSTKFGIEENFEKWMPEMVKTFREFEKAFPDAASLQAFRFQIAQAYWRQKQWKPAREWLEAIVEKDAGANGFYKDLAERRLKKLEY